MNEIDILNLFYDQMQTLGVTRKEVFISIDEKMAQLLAIKLNVPVDLEKTHRLTDICIANEWLERTTADPHYNFLSLTEAGLQMVLMNKYTQRT